MYGVYSVYSYLDICIASGGPLRPPESSSNSTFKQFNNCIGSIGG